MNSLKYNIIYSFYAIIFKCMAYKHVINIDC